MGIRNWLHRLSSRRRLPEAAIVVKTPEQADAINGIFALDSKTFMRIFKLSDPSYGRIVTLDIDVSIPEGRQALENLKVISQFNGNEYADIHPGDHYITMEFKSPEDAEALKAPFVQFEKMKKEKLIEDVPN